MMWVLSNKFRWQAVIRKEGLILFLFILSIHHVEMLKARHDTGDAIVCGIFHNLRLSIFEVSTRKFMHMHNSVNSSVSLFSCCSHAWYFRINIKLKSYIFASNINECVHYPLLLFWCYSRIFNFICNFLSCNMNNFYSSINVSFKKHSTWTWESVFFYENLFLCMEASVRKENVNLCRHTLRI